MKELFLIAALSLPSAIPHHSKPQWDFGENEVKVIRLLRDWANGQTASRPSAWVLIYGRHPHWMLKLRDDKINVIGMYRYKVQWPGFIIGEPLKAPFRDGQFQVYIFDEFPFAMHTLAAEISRLVDDHGFFMYRYTKNGEFAKALQEFGWERFGLDFHEFTIWWRPKNYTNIKLNMSVILRSA